MKIQVTNYTFNHAAGTVTFDDYVSIRLDSVLLVTNATRGAIVYNFADPNLGGSVATNVLTLACDTSTMANGDKLQIWYWDPNAAQSITGSVTVDTSALAREAGGHLAAIDTNAGGVNDAVVVAGATGSVSAKLRRISTDIASLIGGVVISAGNAFIGRVGGADAAGAAPTANPFAVAGLGQSAFPAAGTTGRIAAFFADLFGRLVNKPYAPADADVSGIASTTGTSDTALIAAQGAGLRIHATAVYFFNSGSSPTLITVKDGSGGAGIGYGFAPAGGGCVVPIPSPIKTSTNTALYFAAATSSTTVYGFAVGYKAP